jgi:hypothetical protein
MFKGYALAAAGIPVSTVGPTEALLRDAGTGADARLTRLD